MSLIDSMHWRILANGEYVYEKRARLGIYAQLVPEKVNGNDKEYYTVWLRGTKTQIVLTDQGSPVMYPLGTAVRKAEAMVFHPMFLARAHGIEHAFEKCPRCNTIQKVSIDIANNVLICTICDLKFEPEKI